MLWVHNDYMAKIFRYSQRKIINQYKEKIKEMTDSNCFDVIVNSIGFSQGDGFSAKNQQVNDNQITQGSYYMPYLFIKGWQHSTLFRLPQFLAKCDDKNEGITEIYKKLNEFYDILEKTGIKCKLVNAPINVIFKFKTIITGDWPFLQNLKGLMSLNSHIGYLADIIRITKYNSQNDFECQWYNLSSIHKFWEINPENFYASFGSIPDNVPVPFHMFINQKIHQKYFTLNQQNATTKQKDIKDIGKENGNPCVKPSVSARVYSNFDIDLLHSQMGILSHELSCIWKDLRARLKFQNEEMQEIFNHPHMKKQVKQFLQKNAKRKVHFSFVGNTSKELYRTNFEIIQKIIKKLNDWLFVHEYVVKLEIFRLYQKLFYKISKTTYSSIVQIQDVYDICKKIWNLYAFYFPLDLSPYKIKVLTQIYFRLKFNIEHSQQLQIPFNGLIIGNVILYIYINNIF